MPKNIKGCTISELQEFAVSLGEKPYRGTQLFHALYRMMVLSFEEITTMSKQFRAQLQDAATIETLHLVSVNASPQDNTTKFLFKLSDEKYIESVLIPSQTFEYDDDGEATRRPRLTLCISTQVGCPLDCVFCATGTMGLQRNLTAGEIVEQVLFIKRMLLSDNAEHSFNLNEDNKTLTNVVFMGMGEPMLNFENVQKAVEILSTGIEISAKRITISTAGIPEKIKQMADEQPRTKLAISLHSLDEVVRAKLMPITNKYSLHELFSAAEYYYAKTKQRITFEYILFDGVNDTDEDIHRIVRMSKRIPCKINIIPFHPITFANPASYGATLRATPYVRTEKFIEQLRERNVSVFVRSSSGEDIQAACGQLVTESARRRQTISKREEHKKSNTVSIPSLVLQ
ncbi:MAG: 23S rRNA (adenine(2503)-C(2))-methyltransferase RlmN [Bacteroidota bacterium]